MTHIKYTTVLDWSVEYLIYVIQTSQSRFSKTNLSKLLQTILSMTCLKRTFQTYHYRLLCQIPKREHTDHSVSASQISLMTTLQTSLSMTLNELYRVICKNPHRLVCRVLKDQSVEYLIQAIQTSLSGILQTNLSGILQTSLYGPYQVLYRLVCGLIGL